MTSLRSMITSLTKGPWSPLQVVRLGVVTGGMASQPWVGGERGEGGREGGREGEGGGGRGREGEGEGEGEEEGEGEGEGEEGRE